MSNQSTPRIESLCIQNYRVLHDLELKGITPLTVFLGPNGSGKSTIFHALTFLSDCLQYGLLTASQWHGPLRFLRTSGAEGAIVIEFSYRESPDSALITYHLAVNEENDKPFVTEEWLEWQHEPSEPTLRLLEFTNGHGWVVAGELLNDVEMRINERLQSSDLIAASVLGQLAKYPHLAALRRFITGWHLFNLTPASTRNAPDFGPQDRLSRTGHNLANVVQFLQELTPERFQTILQMLADRIPRLASVRVATTTGGHLILQIKDTSFEQPISAALISDGTLMLLAYLTVLYGPNPSPLIGVDEPENYLHPRLMLGLAEAFRSASADRQILMATHSPYFVDALRPEELWVFYRNEKGFTQVRRSADMQGVKEFIQNGAQLGQLWIESFFEVGDPLTNSGGPKRQSR